MFTYVHDVVGVAQDVDQNNLGDVLLCLHHGHGIGRVVDEDDLKA